MWRDQQVSERTMTKRHVLIIVIALVLAISGTITISSETDASSVDYVYQISSIDFDNDLYSAEYSDGISGSINLADLEKYFTVTATKIPVNADGSLGQGQSTTLTEDEFYLSAGGGLLTILWTLSR